MKRLGHVVLIALAVVAGCSQMGPDGRQWPFIENGGIQSQDGTTKLYVAGAHAVTVYSLQTGSLLRTIPNRNPRALAFDTNGNLYVANDRANRVTVYKRDSDSVLRIIAAGLNGPNSLAFDKSGSLYVSNNNNKSVTVYARDSSEILRTITDGVNGPHQVIFNGHGNLFVGNDGASRITVYPPGDQDFTRALVTHNGPVALAFNRVQDLFSVNNFNVTVYRPGHTLPARTISNGISLPSSLAFDPSGNLYVANWGANMFRSSISVYPPQGSTPKRKISNGISYPLSLLFDSSGDLYVANSAANTVTEYAPNSSEVKRTITKGISVPSVLAFGP